MRNGCSSTRADPEHPAIALAAPDRSAHLVGQSLKCDLLVGLRQAWQIVPFGPSRLSWPRRNVGDRLLVTPVHQVDEAGITGSAPNRGARRFLDLVAIKGVEEERGADAARTGSAASGETARARHRPRTSPRALAPATSSQIERSRIAGSDCVIVSMSCWPTCDMIEISAPLVHIANGIDE